MIKRKKKQTNDEILFYLAISLLMFMILFLSMHLLLTSIKNKLPIIKQKPLIVTQIVKKECASPEIVVVNSNPKVKLSKIALYLNTKYILTHNNILLHDKYFLYELDYSIKKYAKMHKLPYELIYAIIEQESDFNPFLISKARCIGLMQINYKIWKNFFQIPNENTLLNIDKNVQIGVAILSYYYKKTNSLEQAIKAYFGQSNYNKVYFKKVWTLYNKYKQIDKE